MKKSSDRIRISSFLASPRLISFLYSLLAIAFGERRTILGKSNTHDPPPVEGLNRSNNTRGWKNREVTIQPRWNINLWKIKFDEGDGKRSGRAGNGFNAPQGVLLFQELCFLTEIPAGSCNNEAMPILSLQLYLYKPRLPNFEDKVRGRGITGVSRSYMDHFFLPSFFPFFPCFPLFLLLFRIKAHDQSRISAKKFRKFTLADVP